MTPADRRIQMMVGRGVVSTTDDAPGVQELQVELLTDETHDGVEHFQPYGLTAHPQDGAEGLVLAVGGLRSHSIMIAVGDRRYRLRGLKKGEVALHDDQGQHVLLSRDGIVITGKALTCDVDGDLDFSGQNVTFTAAKFDVKSDDVLLGNGAALAAARKTDTVSSGAITGGSTKVKIA